MANSMSTAPANRRLYTELQGVVRDARTEPAQVNAVARVLAAMGVSDARAGKPEVHQTTVERATFRIYVWRDSPFGDHLVLMTGPSFVPRLALAGEVPNTPGAGFYIHAALQKARDVRALEGASRAAGRVRARMSAEAKQAAVRVAREDDAPVAEVVEAATKLAEAAGHEEVTPVHVAEVQKLARIEAGRSRPGKVHRPPAETRAEAFHEGPAQAHARRAHEQERERETKWERDDAVSVEDFLATRFESSTQGAAWWQEFRRTLARTGVAYAPDPYHPDSEKHKVKFTLQGEGPQGPFRMELMRVVGHEGFNRIELAPQAHRGSAMKSGLAHYAEMEQQAEKKKRAQASEKKVETAGAGSSELPPEESRELRDAVKELEQHAKRGEWKQGKLVVQRILKVTGTARGTYGGDVSKRLFDTVKPAVDAFQKEAEKAERAEWAREREAAARPAAPAVPPPAAPAAKSESEEEELKRRLAALFG